MKEPQEDTDSEQPKHPGGRPLKFQTVDELDVAIQNYFAQQDPHTEKRLVATGQDDKGNMLFDTRNVLTEQKPYTMSGLARAIGINRDTLLRYGKKEEFYGTVEAARERVHEYAESQLFGKAATGAAFSLKNNWGWKDRSEIDHTSMDKPIPLLAGLAPATLEVEDEHAVAPADDSTPED